MAPDECGALSRSRRRRSHVRPAARRRARARDPRLVQLHASRRDRRLRATRRRDDALARVCRRDRWLVVRWLRGLGGRRCASAAEAHSPRQRVVPPRDPPASARSFRSRASCRARRSQPRRTLASRRPRSLGPATRHRRASSRRWAAPQRPPFCRGPCVLWRRGRRRRCLLRRRSFGSTARATGSSSLPRSRAPCSPTPGICPR